MSEVQNVFLLQTQPGIQRDGTTLDSNFYSDGQWVRFQRGRPKKIGGYRRITDGLSSNINKLIVWSRQDLNAITAFSTTAVEQVLVDNNGVGNSIIDRTPAGFTGGDDVIWSADTQYDDAVGSQGTVILAHASNSFINIDDGTGSKPYFGLASDSSALTQITDAPSISGGIFAIPPYAVCYGTDGYVEWSNINEPQTWAASTNPGDAGADRVTGAKIVKGLPLRSGSGPAALLWSLDSVLRMDWVGGGGIFRFSTLSTQSSVLSQNSIIEYDGMYFWIGVDRFMYFDSAVHELPNTMNCNFFFDNLNYACRQKVWATKIPRYGEIWWHFPKGDSEVCNHAVIFNVRDKFWFDVELSRSAGMFSQVLRYPVMTGYDSDVYLHEYGRDAVEGDSVSAICSYFTTSDFGLPTGGTQEAAQGLNRWTRLIRVEPDFIQTGDVQMTVIGREFAQADADSENTYTLTESTTKIDMREQHRQIQLKFESNSYDGYMEAGKIILHTEPGDLRS